MTKDNSRLAGESLKGGQDAKRIFRISLLTLPEFWLHPSRTSPSSSCSSFSKRDPELVAEGQKEAQMCAPVSNGLETSKAVRKHKHSV